MSRLDDAVAEAVEEEARRSSARSPRSASPRDDAPVIKLVNSIIAQAVEEGASDIHFEPDGRDMRVRFRVDGVLRETTTIPRRMVAGVVSRIKIMGDLDIAEQRRAAGRPRHADGRGPRRRHPHRHACPSSTARAS